MSLLSNALSRDRNNFDLVRLIAAVTVVYAHSFVVQLPDGHEDPVAVLLGYDYTGSLGVFAFFLLSGLLVTASFDRQRSASRFVLLRASRIWPAVAAASLFAIFLMGPLVTTLPLDKYFSSFRTWSNLDSFSTIVFGRRMQLPGVFDHNRQPYAIFGPLWTLPIEVRYYGVVLITGMLGLLKSRRAIFGAILLGAIPFLVYPHFEPHFYVTLRNLAHKPGGYGFFPEPVFMAGMLLYAFRDRVHISGWTCVALWCAFLVLRGTPLEYDLFYLAFGYAVLWIGTAALLHRFAPRNDYSFGIYIYGFAVQQVIACFWPHLDHMSAFLLTLPFVFACAWVSWHCVEKPALDWTRRRLARSPARSRGTTRPSDTVAEVAPR